MICNAGFGYYGTVEDTPPDIMRRMMDVNFMGTYFGARAALPIFRAQGRGHLIVVSSIVGRRGIAQMSGYSATKAAQVGFAESLRTEFAGTDIHASVVLPVSTETEFREAMERDYGHSVTGLGPKQSADTVAAAVLRCIRQPVAEVYPHRQIAGADGPQRRRARLRRSPGPQIRKAARAMTADVPGGGRGHRPRSRRSRRPRPDRRRLGARSAARARAEGRRPRGVRHPRRCAP